MLSVDWGSELAQHSRVFKPIGPGPFPVALILHGCGGKTPFLEDYARVAVKAGWAAVVVDSFKPRGITPLRAKLTVCTGLAVRGHKRAGDVFAMLAWLDGQDWADAGRVFLAGWSHGGWTIMDAYALSQRAAALTGVSDADPARLRRSVKGALLVYPYAGHPALTTKAGWGEAPPAVWSVIAGKDQVVGWKLPKAALDRLSRDGLAVDELFLPDATHAFDDDHANDPRARHRPDLFQEVQNYFTRALEACA